MFTMGMVVFDKTLSIDTEKRCYVLSEEKGNASTRAKNKYNAKAYDRIALQVKKGKRDVIKAHAEQQGESLNGFINRAIDETTERDNGK